MSLANNFKMSFSCVTTQLKIGSVCIRHRTRLYRTTGRGFKHLNLGGTVIGGKSKVRILRSFLPGGSSTTSASSSLNVVCSRPLSLLGAGLNLGLVFVSPTHESSTNGGIMSLGSYAPSIAILRRRVLSGTSCIVVGLSPVLS